MAKLCRSDLDRIVELCFLVMFLESSKMVRPVDILVNLDSTGRLIKVYTGQNLVYVSTGVVKLRRTVRNNQVSDFNLNTNLTNIRL